ncbi:adenine-specific DNA-methyltransferase [Mobiluncus mulieris]|uniref:Modification methylase MboII n=1 Tax=Mobiluncus mulieris TaxID=2052 RepID=A0A8G2M7C3_9ACTO|nr:site-specific DNA-methyltransferase [Mobiluncus mulieris]MBB5846234.1 adenine-specific DNA-methyltransferase [Mobiluncus mulieris]MCV0001591.1 site-specific DNA-methyltransferase [Mobiluncus mulieris]STO17284.1 Modification methylase MboII [Mobiluncus mulieris]
MEKAQRLELTWYNKDKALIPTETGKYGYTWVDPADPRYCETHTLVFDEYVTGSQTPKNDKSRYTERADLEPQDDNLLILGESGDVLEALTRVPELAEKYVGKVKLIYIDPPFNTAQTFANYEDNLEHSVWLTMMRDRLVNLKKLLREDGSIWVHLDDVEVHRMRLLLDEIFGAGNFVAEVAWQKADSPRSDSKEFTHSVDYVICYRKTNIFAVKTIEITYDTSHYKEMDSIGRRFRYLTLMKTGANSLRQDRPSLFYSIEAPDGSQVLPIKSDGVEGRWRWEKSNVEKRKGEIYWLDKGRGLFPYLRSYKPDDLISPPTTFWSNAEVDANRTAKAEIKALFPGATPFTTPKPERLLERIIHIGSNPGDIVLDCFAGSGTTAAVAQKMGRRWVTCELVADTFERFTKPRLMKVINDQDPGGVTYTKKGEYIPAEGVELPEKISPEDAAKFNAVLKNLLSGDPEEEENPQLKQLKKAASKNPLIKQLKAATKTERSKESINWRGGGGFQVAHLSPACFDYDPELDRVMLTPAATGETLVEAVAANLGFTLLHAEDDYIFDGKRGNNLLKVIEGVATHETVDSLVSRTQPGETITLAATSVMDGVREYLRLARKGSRVVAIPDEIFPYRKGGENNA